MEPYLGDGPILMQHAEVIVQKSGMSCPSRSGDHVLEIEVSCRRDRQTFVHVRVQNVVISCIEIKLLNCL